MPLRTGVAAIALLIIALTSSCVGYRYFPERHQFYGIDSVGQLGLNADFGLHTIGGAGAFSPMKHFAFSAGAHLNKTYLAPRKTGFLIPWNAPSVAEYSSSSVLGAELGAEYYFKVSRLITGNVSVAYGFQEVNIYSQSGGRSFYPDRFYGSVVKDFHVINVTPSIMIDARKMRSFFGCTLRNVFTPLPHISQPVWSDKYIGMVQVISPCAEFKLKSNPLTLGITANFPIASTYNYLMFERVNPYAKWTINIANALLMYKNK